MLRLLRTEGDAFACQALGNAVAGLVVAGETGTPHDLLAELASAAPGVVLLDLNLPGSDAFALLPALREQHPQLRLLAHGELTNEHYVARAFDLGAYGYILKTSNFAELVHGLRTVAAGRPYLQFGHWHILARPPLRQRPRHRGRCPGGTGPEQTRVGSTGLGS